MTRAFFVAMAIAMGLLCPAMAAPPPQTWDDLVSVNSKRFYAAYVLPGADFRRYTKVMFDPTEVSFKKNWIRDYNFTKMGVSRRMTDSDAQKAMDKVRTGFRETFTKVYTEAGYQVVAAPGPDVLRLRTGVIDLTINAPDIPSAGAVRRYAPEAGQATLFLEARDSLSGALLGRVVDRKLAGDTAMWMRNSMTNRNDFKRLFKDWAKESVAGIRELNALPPVAAPNVAAQ